MVDSQGNKLKMEIQRLVIAHIPKVCLNIWPLFGGGLMVLHVVPFYWHMVLGFLMHILEHAQNPYHSMPKKSQHAQKPLSKHAQKNEVMLTH